MAEKSSPLGGGIFIMIGIFAGIFIGRYYGQLSLGLVVGLALGTMAAVAVWLIQRR